MISTIALDHQGHYLVKTIARVVEEQMSYVIAVAVDLPIYTQIPSWFRESLGKGQHRVRIGLTEQHQGNFIKFCKATGLSQGQAAKWLVMCAWIDVLVDLELLPNLTPDQIADITHQRVITPFEPKAGGSLVQPYLPN